MKPDWIIHILENDRPLWQNNQERTKYWKKKLIKFMLLSTSRVSAYKLLKFIDTGVDWSCTSLHAIILVDFVSLLHPHLFRSNNPNVSGRYCPGYWLQASYREDSVSHKGRPHKWLNGCTKNRMDRWKMCGTQRWVSSSIQKIAMPIRFDTLIN